MKKKLFIFCLFTFFLISLFSVNALDCGFAGPTPTSGNITSIANATFSNPGATEPSIAIAFYIQGSGNTQNTTLSLINNVTNSTGFMPSSGVNTTISDNYVFQDGNDYTLSCTCTNSTTVVNCNATRTSMQWNRNKPTIPTSITFTNPITDGKTITSTINRMDSNICYIQFGGNSRQTMTLSGTTCTYTVSKNNPPNGDYPIKLSASDRIDTIAESSIQYATIRAVPSTGNTYSGIVTTPSDSSQSTIGGDSTNPFLPNSGFKLSDKAIGIILIIVLTYLYTKNK